jgi:AcrR family transcriptional regulator
MTVDQKQAARRGIVEAAGRLFRVDGYTGVGMDRIAQALSQTTGAIYSHYGAKRDVFAAVVEAGVGRLIGAADRARHSAASDWVLAFAKQYLSPAHGAAVADGCLLPTLTQDVTRADGEVRDRFAERLRAVARQLGEGCGPRASDNDAAAAGWAILALCAGGIMLSRVAADEAVADEILGSCRAAVTRLLADDPSSDQSSQ